MKKIFILLAIFIFSALGFYMWYENAKKPVNPSDKSEKIFVIQRGKDVRSIASDLKKENLIRDPIIFFIHVKLNSLDKKIQAGDFKLSPSMRMEETIDTLMHGTLDIWVTVPEGLRAEEVSTILKRELPNYNDSWEYELMKHNGFLFPDTYLIPIDADIEAVVTLMRNNFTKKLEAEGINEYDDKRLFEIVIIASLIEREVRRPEEKPLVASVIYNRLRSGMPLQIDATVQYALSYQEDTGKWWKKDLTLDDLKIDSAYNTYNNIGLPPMPISNPGILSLKAATNPVDTNYFYYISDGEGKSHFAETLAEHNGNVVKYLRN
jgi:UPF0755 protein